MNLNLPIVPVIFWALLIISFTLVSLLHPLKFLACPALIVLVKDFVICFFFVWVVWHVLQEPNGQYGLLKPSILEWCSVCSP